MDDDDFSDVQTEVGTPDQPQFFGSMADQLDAWARAKKDKTKEGVQVYENLAGFMMDQLEQGFNSADLDYSIKDYPTITNVPMACAPELERDLFEHTKFQKDLPLKATELALKSIQRGVASSINALGPVAEVVMRQCEDNEELDGISTAVLDVIKLLSNVLGGLTKKRRDLLRHILDAKYQKLGKGDEDFDIKYLFGGNLPERARKVRANNSVMNEILKPDPKQNTQTNLRRAHHPYGGGPHRNGGQGYGSRQGYRQNGSGRNNQGRSSRGFHNNPSGGNASNSNNGRRDFRKQGQPSNKNKQS